jgi:hypothetical protein
LRVLDANGKPVPHDAALLDRSFDEALAVLVSELPLGRDAGNDATLTEACRQSRWMIDRGLFDPV